MQQKITTNKARILAVLLPDTMTNPRMIHDGHTIASFDNGYEKIKLDGGPWHAIGFAKDLTEEQWKGIVDSMHGSYAESGSSLLKANKCYLENPYREKSCGGKPYCCQGKRCEWLNWNEAQSRTGNWFLLEKVK